MEIAALQAFIAVAEQRSFSLAAQQLFITQPAVSKRIAVLEQELDAQLFDRIGRQVHLTEAGRALLPHARHILNELADSRRAIHQLSGEVGGELLLGTSHHIGLHRLPPILKEYTRRWPQVVLNLRFMDSEAACRAIEHGELELAVVTLPLHPGKQLRTELLWDDPLQVVCALDHPLAAQGSASLADLARHPALLPGPGTFTREIVELAFAPTEHVLHEALSTNYLETLKMLTVIGLGWSVLPATMVDRDLRVLNTPLKLARQLGLVQHTRRTPSNAAMAMVELLRKNHFHRRDAETQRK
jgi:DNA-binding transcriptional LysR family regulator